MGRRILITAGITRLGASTPVAARDDAGVMGDGSDLVPAMQTGLAITATR